MKKIFKNYKLSIYLVISIIIGTIIGLIFKEKSLVLAPFGKLFINLLLVIIIPLIFTTITTSIAKVSNPKRISKILTSIIIVFVITSLISALISIFITKNISLINVENQSTINTLIENDSIYENEEINFLEKTVDTISTNDFYKLLSTSNIVALIIFSIIFGISIKLSKENGKQFLNFLNSLNDIIQKYLTIIMYYAPIGLACYFASLVGSYGTDMIIGFGKTIIIYLLVTLLFYFIIYSLYVFIAKGKQGLKLYWKNIIPSSITALSTCSSAASIPVNINCTKKMDISDDIVNTTIPLGTSFHKDGSVIGSVFKIMFLVYLFNYNISLFELITVSLLATLLIVAVPIGGGTISEMLIITSLGFPLGALPILTVIATLIDPPATLLNVVGDSASSILVSRIVDGKK